MLGAEYLIFILMLSVFLGFELINKVPATLHTPLMSGANAISGITVVGAIALAGNGRYRPMARCRSGCAGDDQCCRWLYGD